MVVILADDVSPGLKFSQNPTESALDVRRRTAEYCRKPGQKVRTTSAHKQYEAGLQSAEWYLR